jgi:flavin-binding protein dodecin
MTFGVVAVVSAQNPSSSQTSTPQTRSSQSSSRSVTITGCLQSGSNSATGTTGTASSSRAASAGGYLLMNATMGSSAAMAGAGTQYRLDADESKLSPHVGHKVEVTGTIDESSSSAAGSATSTAAMSSPRLKVDSVKMVSSTCVHSAEPR